MTADRRRLFPPGLVILAGLLALAAALMLSISVGAAGISLRTVWNALVHFTPGLTQHQIIYELRLPRALAGALVGAGLAASGAIMQGMTRNPLASPGLLGVNAGAAFFLAATMAFFPGAPYALLMAAAFAGAAFGSGLVYGIGSLARGGLTPARLALAGAAVGALLHALESGLAIHFQVAQDLSFWFAGGIAGIKWLQIRMLLPWAVLGLIGAVALSGSITVLSLGDEVAKGLGQRTALVKVAGTVLVLIMTGAAVSTAGPVGFIGLVVPHVTRYLVGMDYRWVIPGSAVLGGLLLVLADVGARLVNPPFETPVGALTAAIGVPFFLYLATTDRGGR